MLAGVLVSRERNQIVVGQFLDQRWHDFKKGASDYGLVPANVFSWHSLLMSCDGRKQRICHDGDRDMYGLYKHGSYVFWVDKNS